MKRLMYIAGALAALALSTTAFAQTDRTFQPSSGVWHLAGNWLPSGIPGSNDSATIPAGRTCNISTGNASTWCAQHWGWSFVNHLRR